jgi:hypothetical protein
MSGKAVSCAVRVRPIYRLQCAYAISTQAANRGANCNNGLQFSSF